MMNCKLSNGELMLAVVTAASFILLIFFTWEAGQSALPPPPVDNVYRRPPIRGHPGLYPSPAPLLDLKEISFIANSAVCENSKGPVLLLFLVFSHPSHDELRDAHRNHTSWEVLEYLGAKRVFLLADGSRLSQKGYPAVPTAAVLRESAKYHDLVVASFTDHYRNLSYKHASGLDWANRFCPQAKYIMKMDDDIMVDVWGMVKLLKTGLVANNVGVIHSGDIGVKTLDHRGTWAAGLVQRGLRPQRRRGKWKVTKAEFSDTMYPNYLSGWAYLITQPAALAIMEAAADKKPFWIDDVYMTGILAVTAGVPRYALNHHYTLLTGAVTCCLESNTSKKITPSSFSLTENEVPLCNLLVAPSEKNITLLTEWLKTARECHSDHGCRQRTLDHCPPTMPHFGVGTVIPLSG